MGFGLAAPVGPIGLLCIRRSITDGRVAGFVSGLGAATADAIYGAIAALGLTAVTGLLLAHHVALQFIGALFLVYIGVSVIRAKPPARAAGSAHAANLLNAYSSTLALTLANPATILTFIGIFTGLGIGVTSGGFTPAVLLVAGVFLGSAAWWLFLSAAASWLGRKADLGGLHLVNLGSGMLIIGFGAWQLASLLLAL